MKPRNTLVPFCLALLLASCGGEPQAPATGPAKPADNAPAATASTPAYPAGFYTAEMIDPPPTGEIDQSMVDEAMKIFNAKCKACHGLTDQKVVGPGWKGVIKERKPEWIMNMMLHTQWMVENDPEAQQLVEETKAVMTDQELTDKQARAMLELIRSL